MKQTKLSIAKQICADLGYAKEDCLQALVARLCITRGNASIYFAKAVDGAYDDAKGVVATKPVKPTVTVPKAKEQSDASKAKVRDAHNKAHKHLSYTEPPKA
jgi:hypothetical protein